MAFPARPQPAAPTHESVHRIRRKSPLQSCRAIHRSLVHTNLYEQASPQADRGSRSAPTSASPNPRRNPHSARGTAATHIPRFRALALFGRRPPQRVVRPSSRQPKTCTGTEVAGDWHDRCGRSKSLRADALEHTETRDVHERNDACQPEARVREQGPILRICSFHPPDVDQHL